MNVLVINGHPRKGSFSEAIANAYTEGARKSGAKVTLLNLYELSFEPNVIVPSPAAQFLEKDVLYAQKLITESQHIAFVFPTWWGTMPALLKAFTDRVFTEGWAFGEIEGGTGYIPLLNGRSALLITTMDTPKFVYNFFYHSPGYHAMSNALLKFCGFRPVKLMSIGLLKKKSAAKHRQWLEKVSRKGEELRKGNISGWERLKIKLGDWLKAIRLQFYPMSFVAYTTGAFAADYSGYGFDKLTFWLGYLWLFFLEVATVLSNEYFDYRSDVTNRHFGPFTGGSRVLVNNFLKFGEIRAGIITSLALAVLFLSSMFLFTGNCTTRALITSSALLILALGYTIPPFKFSYRGLGELVVGITHSFALILSGYIFQGGQLNEPFPWWLSLPLFLSVLPSITLAGIPDYEADKRAGKKTLAVRLGKKNAARLAMGFCLCALIAVIAVVAAGLAPGAYGLIIYMVIPHGLVVCWLLLKYTRDSDPPHRIDGLMIAALSFILWFGVVPLFKLW